MLFTSILMPTKSNVLFKFIEELPTDTVVEGKHFPLPVWQFSLLPQIVIVLVSGQNNSKNMQKTRSLVLWTRSSPLPPPSPQGRGAFNLSFNKLHFLV